jgi:hypothetical protein
MRIDYLGHSEFLVELSGDKGCLRIMNDVWLSSHAFGDFLARNPRLPDKAAQSLPPVDGLYISHPHCDHCDPYTLVQLYKKQRPVLLIPETIAYLRPLFQEYLNHPEIVILHEGEKVRFRGVTLQGMNFVNGYHTNEDDVMCLAISGNEDFAFFEGDTAIPDTEEAWEGLYRLAAAKKFKNRLYVAVRNELEALYLAYDLHDRSTRRRLMQQYRRRRFEEIRNDFEKFLDSDVPAIWSLPGMVRILIGQGMMLPPELDERFLRLSAPFPLTEVAAEERKVAARTTGRLTVLTHRPGFFAEIEEGRIIKEGRLPYLERVEPYPVSYDSGLILKREPIHRPLRNERRNIEKQKELILNLLNCRYRPALAADLEEPLKKIIREAKGHTYVIEIKYGTAGDYQSVYYGIGFEDFIFSELATERRNVTEPAESYWANDLEDYLNGTQDMFSTTLHTFEEGRSIRLWSWLGLPFLNSDLVMKKMAVHFERAARGETVEDWVLPLAAENLRFD